MNTKAKTSSMTTRQLKPRDTLINRSKRLKLQSLLVQRYRKMFGGFANEDLIESEVKKFLQRDKITENDLKTLEKNIQTRLEQKQEADTLRHNLTHQQQQQHQHTLNPIETTNTQQHAQSNIILPTIHSNKVNIANCDTMSGMSGGSDLSKFDEHGPGDQALEEEKRDFKKIDFSKKSKPKAPPIDYAKYNDEWDAINMYNKKLFEEEKLMNKMKDIECQRRMKNDLDVQVRAKLKREYEEKLKEQEYDVIMDRHLKHLNDLEEKKRIEVKKRILKEKESRDKQLHDEYVRKRIDLLKKRKYERELVKVLKEEIDREKRLALEKKAAEKEALQKTLKDNELRRQKLLEDERKEKELDVKMMEDDAKVKQKQENERIEYFKRIERSSNSFMDQMVNTVLKEQERKNKEEEDKIKAYNAFRDQQEELAEQRKQQLIKDNKRMIREYLDKQMEERRQQKEYEKQVDQAQGRIWKQDTQNYIEHEKEVNAIIRMMNKNNLNALKSQIEYAEKNKLIGGMSQNEREMNRELLDKVATMQ